MPAPYGRRDWQTKADRALNRMGRGSSQGRFSGARPVLSGVGQVQPGTVDTLTYGELHEIETFDVTGTGTASFRLDHEPVFGSWNVSWNGVTQRNNVDYTVTGRNLAVIDTATLFANASSTYPGVLEIQYDYLIPGENVAWTSSVLGYNWAASSALAVTATGARASGDLLVAGLTVETAASLPTISGWTLGASVSNTNIRTGVYTREATNTSGDNLAVTLSASTGWGVMAFTISGITFDTTTPVLHSATGTASGASATIPGGYSAPDDAPVFYAWGLLGGGGANYIDHAEAVLTSWANGDPGDPSPGLSLSRGNGSAVGSATMTRGSATESAYALVVIDGAST